MPLIIFVMIILLIQPITPVVSADQNTSSIDNWEQDYTYRLEQSTASYEMWTTLPSERVFKDSAVPVDTGSEVKVYAARNEYEPFQVVLKPTISTAVTVISPDFGPGIEVEIYQVKYVYISQTSDNLGRLGDYPDPLWPLESGSSVSVSAGENTAFWFNLAVSHNVVCGDYTAMVQIAGISVPVRLHVFDFAIPDELHVLSQMNANFNEVLTRYSVPCCDTEYWYYVDSFKQFFIDHRLTPKGPLWPGGLTSNGGGPFIDYDCGGNLSDPHGIWGFVQPADKYLNGNGFNEGIGFPCSMAATFQDNDPSTDQRPSLFCGQTRSAMDWYTGNNPNTPYNQKWFEYMSTIEAYLTSYGYLDRSYYYLANEPQDQADYDAVAWYSQELKIAAPGWKLMVSEEPKPEIYAHPTYTGSKIDIWLAVLNNYDPVISYERELNHAETTWVYFLHGTRPPYFNPITLDHPGIESKFIGWFLWKYRVRGMAYYSMNNWNINPWTNPMTDGHNGDTFMLYPPSEDNTDIPYGSNNHRFVPSIRFELMRDSLEDYEYLFVLNDFSQPIVGLANPADLQADKIIKGLTSYTRNSEFMYNLRRLIGLKNGGEIDQIPDLDLPLHPRAAASPTSYYLNFQDPIGQPTAEPLIVNGHEYQKIGWSDYNETVGLGWYGDMAHVMYQWLSNGPNPLQRSVIYDDWGRQKTFDFDLPNCSYQVTVSVGWQGGNYLHNKIWIEGIPFIDDEASNPYLVRTNDLSITDYMLTMEMGIFDEYTMLNYLDIVVIDSDMDGMPDCQENNFTCLDPDVDDAGLDPDYDYLINADELLQKTDPCLGDSDAGGENDGSELHHGRDPLNPQDDLDLTLKLTRLGTTITLIWDQNWPPNSSIEGYYFVYRSTSPELSASDMIYGPLPNGTEQQADDPDCDICYYLVRNSLLP
ncbi:DUF4091 domain-containing protein [bacterium]|nr:DUF4091 domain-containing protein [bacterium]